MLKTLLSFEFRRWQAAWYLPFSLAILGAVAFQLCTGPTVLSFKVWALLLFYAFILGRVSSERQAKDAAAYLAARGVKRSWFRWLSVVLLFASGALGVGASWLANPTGFPKPKPSLKSSVSWEVAHTLDLQTRAFGGQLQIEEPRLSDEIAAPLTSQLKKRLPVHVEVPGFGGVAALSLCVAMLLGAMSGPQTLRRRWWLWLSLGSASALHLLLKHLPTEKVLLSCAWLVSHGAVFSLTAVLLVVAVAWQSTLQWRKADLS